MVTGAGLGARSGATAPGDGILLGGVQHPQQEVRLGDWAENWHRSHRHTKRLREHEGDDHERELRREADRSRLRFAHVREETG